MNAIEDIVRKLTDLSTQEQNDLIQYLNKFYGTSYEMDGIMDRVTLATPPRLHGAAFIAAATSGMQDPDAVGTDFTGTAMLQPGVTQGDVTANIFAMLAGELTAGFDNAGNWFAAGKTIIANALGFFVQTVAGVKFISFTSTKALFGSDTSAANTTALAIFFAAQTYNTESMEAGSVLFGSNSAAYANVLWRPSTKQLQFRTATTVQAYVDTDGAVKAGAGAVVLDALGLRIIVSTSEAALRALTFVNSAGSIVYGGLYSFLTGAVNTIRLKSLATTGNDSITAVISESLSGEQARVLLSVYDGVATAELELKSTSGGSELNTGNLDVATITTNGNIGLVAGAALNMSAATSAGLTASGGHLNLASIGGTSDIQITPGRNIGLNGPTFITGALAVTGAITATTNITATGTVLGSNYNPAANVAAFLATPSSANMRAALTDENGTGAALFDGATSPDFIGTITAINLNLSGSIELKAPVTVGAATYTQLVADSYIIANRAGTITITLIAASSYSGHRLVIKTITANTVVSASSNVVPLAGGAAGTAILAATAGKWVELISDGTNWIIMAGA